MKTRSMMLLNKSFTFNRSWHQVFTCLLTHSCPEQGRTLRLHCGIQHHALHNWRTLSVCKQRNTTFGQSSHKQSWQSSVQQRCIRPLLQDCSHCTEIKQALDLTSYFSKAQSQTMLQFLKVNSQIFVPQCTARKALFGDFCPVAFIFFRQNTKLGRIDKHCLLPDEEMQADAFLPNSKD